MWGRVRALLRHGAWAHFVAACSAALLVGCGGGGGDAAGDPPLPTTGPTVVSLNYVAGASARLEVTFSEPMTPTYFTTGNYVPASSVWETSTRFVVTFTSVSPGGVITLKAPTTGDARGFKSAAGVNMPADVAFQFPTAAGAGSAPTVIGLHYVATAPQRLEVTFSEPMGSGYGTTGNYVPTSSVWESGTRFVVTFSSVTAGGVIVLKAPAGGAGGFRSAAGVAMPADVSFRFPTSSGPAASRPVVRDIDFVGTAPARLAVTFSEPMATGYDTSGAYVPSSSVWESTTRFVITFSSFTPGGSIVLKADGFRSVAGSPMSADLSFTFPAAPPAGSGAPAVTGLRYAASGPARLEVDFGEPMSPTYFTTGAYVPTSSVWDTTTRFVISFSSVSPGGVILLKAPTVGDSAGFRSAAGVGMAADVPFQFPPAD